MPEQLSAEPKILWELPLAQPGLGGIAATDRFVFFGDRDFDNFQDVFRCLDANTGAVQWEISRLGIGALDYGNSPRATPLVDESRVYFAGAHGAFVCADIESGDVLWEVDLKTYQPQGELPWGYCGSPLLVDDKVIVAPGGPQASLIAFNARSGNEVWRSPGGGPSHGSMILAQPHGRRQIVGHDATSLGGWDPETGRRLWGLTPEAPGDFNVPTPISYGDRVLVTTENNGTRLYPFQPDGLLDSANGVRNDKLHPSMSTPVIVNDRLYCVDHFLFCLDLRNDLKELWRRRDPAIGEYAALLASAERLLVIGEGELLLFRTDGSPEPISRQRIFDERMPLYSHPAIVGKRLYLRGETKLVCVEL